MTDFLLIHGAGHGGWVWDQVLGLIQHDLRRKPGLYNNSFPPGRVLTPDLPGHGARYQTDDPIHITFDQCVEELLELCEGVDLNQLIIGVHSLSGLIALELIRRAKIAPKALVLVGGIVPDLFHNVLEMLPITTRALINILRLQPNTPPETVKLHKEVGTRLLCNGMRYPDALSKVVGRLRPIPLHPWNALPHPEALEPKCPVTYILLNQDKFVPAATQSRMANTFPQVTVQEINSGHEAPITHPKEVAEALLGYFLSPS